MQVKTTVKYHLTSVRMAVIKKKREQMLMRLWTKENPYAPLAGI